jgi:prolyl-tRNA synthetase
MQDGLALQAGTSHFLGQNFAKGFNIQYLDSDNQLKHVWTTSWGLSTRILGALIMVHGDDKGLRLPPRMAPTQVVIVPIAPAAQRPAVLEQVHALAGELKQRFRLHVDDREEFTPGWKFNEWEMRGVPVRVEIGPRDLAAGQAIVVRRDTGEKATVPLAGLADFLGTLLETVQSDMFAAAQSSLAAHTRNASTFDELASIIANEKGFVLAPWCDSKDCEAAIKEQTKATTRNIPFDQPDGLGGCVYCGQPAKHHAIFARAY